eukprot:1281814-Amphidinium_carterae.1
MVQAHTTCRAHKVEQPYELNEPTCVFLLQLLALVTPSCTIQCLRKHDANALHTYGRLATALFGQQQEKNVFALHRMPHKKFTVCLSHPVAGTPNARCHAGCHDMVATTLIPHH